MRLFKCGGAVVFLAAVGFGLAGCTTPQPVTPMDQFAQCLTENGAIMYGTDTCPACRNQKTMFGDAFAYLEYVNCSFDQASCQTANVSSIPQWFVGDERLQVGVTPLTVLAEKTGCELPETE